MKVLIAGNFDVIHPGHIHFLTEASKLGEVIVVVARDETIKIQGTCQYLMKMNAS